MTRKHISTKIEKQVLIKSKRRCPLCFQIDFDDAEKEGQIAHLDQNNSNNKFDNLAFLCLKHHDKYDSTTSQSKGYTQNEVKQYRDELYEIMELQKSSLWDTENQMESIKQEKRRKLSIEVYDRKIEIYREVRDFLSYLTATAEVDIDRMFEFSKKTDEVVFLFDEEVANYISQIYKKAIQQRYINKRLSDHRLPVGDRRTKLAEEDYEISGFYSEQRKKLKKLFSKYIYLE